MKGVFKQIIFKLFKSTIQENKIIFKCDKIVFSDALLASVMLCKNLKSFSCYIIGRGFN